MDDSGVAGGIADGAHFIVMGDLNADPIAGPGEEGRLLPARTWLVDSGAFNTTITPTSLHAEDGQRADLTATWRRRVDYALPGAGLPITRAAVFRGWLDAAPGGLVGEGPYEMPSDHFPVWIDVAVPVNE